MKLSNREKYSREYLNKLQKTWRAAHPERYRELGSKGNEARSWRNRKLREQLLGRPKPSQCEVCGNQSARIVFDHCHITGRARGWLCFKCNAALGNVNDNPEILRKLADYLSKFKG